MRAAGRKALGDATRVLITNTVNRPAPFEQRMASKQATTVQWSKAKAEGPSGGLGGYVNGFGRILKEVHTKIIHTLS